MITCRECGSDNVEVVVSEMYSKTFDKYVYHHRLYCNNCKKTYNIKKTKDSYDALNRERIMQSKNVIKHDLQTKLF